MVVTSKQILDALEIRNIKTLTRWYQKGVIPEPLIQSQDGAGRIACWPPWVLKHCKVIKELTSEGKTLREIAESFGNDWEKLGRRYRAYNFQDDAKNKQEAEELYSIADAISERLDKKLVEIRQAISASRVQVASMEISEEALALAKDGYNPILVISPPLQVFVVPDFVVGEYLSKHFDAVDTVIVIPLFAICKSHAPAKSLPAAPTRKPVARVTSGKGASASESTVRISGGWEFAVEPISASRKSARSSKKNR